MLDFARNIIKGKIAEIIFEFMFCSSGQYTVIPFGYEYSQSEIAQNLILLENKGLLETLRSTPDFILISKDKTQVYFVEVKFRNKLENQQIKEIAQKVVHHWDHAFLFIATPQGFYYEPCHTIIKNEGEIGELYEILLFAK
jgi:F0F1-type ATP synthase delta subunit